MVSIQEQPRARRGTAWPFLVAIPLILMASSITAPSLGEAPAAEAPLLKRPFDYPKVPPDHRYMRLLLDNAFRYMDPAHGVVDPVSGYPVEGWNQEPSQGLFLRSFTQLTAIGVWIELLANIAAGYADNPYIARESALEGLSLAVGSLLEDQGSPALAAKGLLVNFLGLEDGKRAGPLLESIEQTTFIETFGDQQGQAIWRALVERGWLQEEDNGRTGRIRRGDNYGAAHFDGVLAPYSEDPLRSRILGLLDQRVVTIIFGDNANLTASLARSAGALLAPGIRDDPRAAVLREQIEHFIARQEEGYSHLFDPETGTFVFGWDATRDRFVGWDDGRGNWVTGQMNYFINEFRGPWTFVLLRYGLPIASVRNAGFKIKPYTHGDGGTTYALAAWEGSAFQLLGLSVFMEELRNPSWKRSLEALVDIELDFSTRRGLPGLLSEAYSGNGTEYTGLIGIPDIAVTDKALITKAPSLYTLGVAYSIAPEQVEGFLRDHWPLISGLFTPHGPWEGWNMAERRVIPYQTTVHTLSLILGGISSAQENMRRYLEDKGLASRLAALYQPGEWVDLLAAGTQVVPWTSDESPCELSREAGGYRFTANLSEVGGVAFIVPGDDTVSLSNGRLVLRFQSKTPVKNASIVFKRADGDPLPPPAIPIEIFARFPQTQDGALEFVLPATPALSGIKEISLALGGGGRMLPVDLAIQAFEFIPFDTALAASQTAAPLQSPGQE